jgi:hypothetical protein
MQLEDGTPIVLFPLYSQGGRLHRFVLLDLVSPCRCTIQIATTSIGGRIKGIVPHLVLSRLAALARLWQHLQMSRGSGHIERSIQSLIERMRTNERSRTAVLINSWVIVGEVFRPRSLFMRDWHWQPTVAQRKAVARAMHSFVHKFPQFALLGGQGRKKLYLYDTTDPDSVLWAQMTLASKDHVPFMSVKGSQKA